MNSRTLPLYEEILLLALDDDQGTTTGAGFYCNAMGGAILAELAMTGVISIDDDKKKKVHLVRHSPLQDPILEECRTLMAEANKPKKAVEWVTKFSGVKDLKNRAARQLVARGVLTEETDKVLLVFNRTIYPEADEGPERELRERMKNAIFTDTDGLDPRTVVIIALAEAAGMLPKVFPKRKLKERKDRLEQLTSGQLVGKATKEAVQAVQAAIMVAAIMPAVIVATR